MQLNDDTISKMPSSAGSPSIQAPFPPLSISDLLVLTLTTSFGFAWCASLGGGDPVPESGLWIAFLTAFEGMLIGVELFGFVVLVREWLRGRPLASFAPGHWWFVVTAPYIIVGLVRYIVAVWSEANWFADHREQWRVIDSIVHGLICLIFAALWLFTAAAISVWRWRAVFALRALEQIDWLLFESQRAARNAAISWAPNIHPMHFFGLMGTVHVLMLLAVAVAAAIDLRRKVRRDWLHYLGVGAMLADSVDFFQGFGVYSVRWWSALWLRLTG